MGIIELFDDWPDITYTEGIEKLQRWESIGRLWVLQQNLSKLLGSKTISLRDSQIEAALQVLKTGIENCTETDSESYRQLAGQYNQILESLGDYYRLRGIEPLKY